MPGSAERQDRQAHLHARALLWGVGSHSCEGQDAPGLLLVSQRRRAGGVSCGASMSEVGSATPQLRGGGQGGPSHSSSPPVQMLSGLDGAHRAGESSLLPSV